jgi:hypothetical protein
MNVEQLSTSHNSHYVKLNKFLETQQIAKITNAKNSLEQFRTQNEKKYKDKESEELKFREIQKPLEDAFMEIRILQDKLERREVVIKQLRQDFLLASLQRNLTDAEKVNLFEKDQKDLLTLKLFDDISILQSIITANNKNEAKLKRIMSFQSEKIKYLLGINEKNEFYYNEKIRKLEELKNRNANKLQKEILNNQNLLIENNQFKNEINELKNLNSTLQLRFDEKNSLFNEIELLFNSEKVEKQSLLEKKKDTENLLQISVENNNILQDKNTVLQSRYYYYYYYTNILVVIIIFIIIIINSIIIMIDIINIICVLLINYYYYYYY